MKLTKGQRKVIKLMQAGYTLQDDICERRYLVSGNAFIKVSTRVFRSLLYQNPKESLIKQNPDFAHRGLWIYTLTDKGKEVK